MTDHSTFVYKKQDIIGLRELHRRGAQIIPVRGWDSGLKIPLTKGWQYRRYGLDGLIRYAESGSPVGYLPSSLGLAGVDIDDGDARAILELHPSLCSYRTSKEERLHILYSQPVRRVGNGRFEDFLGCSGDVRGRGKWRGPGGFLLAWPGSLSMIAASIADFNGRDTPMFPTQLAEHIEKDGKMNRPYRAAPKSLRKRAFAPKGTRNGRIFDDVWDWARRRDPDEDRDEWIGKCEKKALEFARKAILDWSDFDEDEAAVVGSKIGEYVYAKRSGWLKLQASRGRRSGLSKRKKTLDRDRRIFLAYQSGQKQKDIAAAEGLTPPTVHYIIQRSKKSGGVHA